MFGVGKLIGGVLDKVGLGKIAPFVSLGVNALTGNWAGAAMDVAGLANRLTGGKLGFLNKVAQFAPLASAFLGGGAGIGDLFKSGGLSKLVGNFKNLTNFKNITANFKGLTDGFKGAQQGLQAIKGGNILGGASKIFKAFEAVNEFVQNKELFNTRSANQHRQLSLGNIGQER